MDDSMLSDESTFSLEDEENSDFYDEDVAPVQPARTGTSKKASNNTKVLQDVNVATNKTSKKPTKTKATASNNTAKRGAKSNSKTIEQIYQKKSQLEHILLRPDSYVGSIESISQQMWVFDNQQQKLVNRTTTYVPGLYKIFDEILVNAADNKQRDASMNKLQVWLNAEENSISICNNGRGIPVVVHQEHNIYVPELIFGNLLTSSNYDDDERKVTGGRNGYGAKLANIFSTKFIVETYDSETGLEYKQTFSNNMSQKEEPIIKRKTKGEDYTRITFYPDLARFGMEVLDEDIMALMTKRVYDMAGVTDKSVKVYLNDQRLPVNTFSEYVNLYITDEDAPRVHEKINDRWEIVVSLSDGQFQQVSFVNAICTIKGGQHVNYLADQITQEAAKSANKKNKGVQVKPFHVKNHLTVFVNSLIENPAFDSQTKETLTTRQSSFGSSAVLSPKFVKAVLKGGIVDRVLSWAKFKQTAELKRKGGAKKVNLVGIPKLDDANDAGGSKAQDCTLILTEGDSAKTLAVSGLSIVGRDKYGVFPLKGKLLNVREASHTQIMNNSETQNIVKILGLQYGKQYESTKGLRYGHLLIMADQDHDGSHIKGLVINFIHHFWPSLLYVDGFLQEFITPIVKVSRGTRTLPFFTYPEYIAWRNATNNGRGWSIKYYKGLGTSTAKEAKEYFANLDRHVIDFEWEGDESGNLIDLAFSKKRADDRKRWLLDLEEGTYVDYAVESMRYSDFINRELILFSMADNIRSIPSVIDGLKPAQRKVLFACFKRNLTKEIKVAQLAGYVSEHAAYHHGEASLAATIIGMAQNFLGSNNINLLVPSGQFGTRLMGGKDAASPRYIFTKLSPIARAIYHPDDDFLLKYNDEDGMSIEPEWYMPVIPMALVNGSDGIGTGWSSSVPNYNPRDLIANIRRRLHDETGIRLAPWYRGFTGEIVPRDANYTSFTVRGTGWLDQVGDDNDGAYEGSNSSKQREKAVATVCITELPIRRWTQDYKTFLEGMLPGAEKEESKKGAASKTKKTTKTKKTKGTDDDESSVATGANGSSSKPGSTALITEFRENHTDTTVSFQLSLTQAGLQAMRSPSALRKLLKLDGTLSTSNMHLFDAANKIKRYDTPEAVVDDFIPLRLEYYEKRKEFKLGELKKSLHKLNNKVRFILAVVNGELKVSNVKKASLMATLQREGYSMILGKAKLSNLKQNEDGHEDNLDNDDDDVETSDHETQSKENLAKGYNYLLSMPLWSLTLEKVQSLRKELMDKEAEYEALLKMSPRDLWLNDLDALEDCLCEFEAELEAEQEEERQARTRISSQKKTTKNKKKKAVQGGKAGGKIGAQQRKAASLRALEVTEKVEGVALLPTSNSKKKHMDDVDMIDLSEDDWSDDDSEFETKEIIPKTKTSRSRSTKSTVAKKNPATTASSSSATINKKSDSLINENKLSKHAATVNESSKTSRKTTKQTVAGTSKSNNKASSSVAATKTTTKATTSPQEPIDSSVMSLAERLALRMQVSPQKTSKPATKQGLASVSMKQQTDPSIKETSLTGSKAKTTKTTRNSAINKSKRPSSRKSKKIILEDASDSDVSFDSQSDSDDNHISEGRKRISSDERSKKQNPPASPYRVVGADEHEETFLSPMKTSPAPKRGRNLVGKSSLSSKLSEAANLSANAFEEELIASKPLSKSTKKKTTANSRKTVKIAAPVTIESDEDDEEVDIELSEDDDVQEETSVGSRRPTTRRRATRTTVKYAMNEDDDEEDEEDDMDDVFSDESDHNDSMEEFSDFDE